MSGFFTLLKRKGEKIKMFASSGECVTRTSHSCNDAAHKFLMLLVIHPLLLAHRLRAKESAESNEIFER